MGEFRRAVVLVSFRLESSGSNDAFLFLAGGDGGLALSLSLLCSQTSPRERGLRGLSFVLLGSYVEPTITQNYVCQVSERFVNPSTREQRWPIARQLLPLTPLPSTLFS